MFGNVAPRSIASEPTPKVGTDGKKVPYTQDELADLKKPYGVPGYLASTSDLKTGQYVDLIMVRPRDIPASSNVLYAHLGGQLALNAYSGLFRS